MSTTHPIPSEWLTAYYDGELDKARQKQVEAHLAECPECRRELGEMRSLSQALGADELPQAELTGAATFWQGVQSQLPERRPAAAPAKPQRVLLRWSPGIGLLLINGLLQVAAAAGTVLLLVPARLWSLPDWAGFGYQIAADSSLGWLAWLVPGSFSWLGLVLWWLTLSAGLAVLYLAWLGYELRYGASARYGRVVA
jgi:anti-sigma factor RsiW